MSKTLDFPQDTTMDDHDRRQRYYACLMYGALAAWTRSTHQSTPSGKGLQVISPSAILSSKSVVHALSVLPDSKLIDFMTWLHGRSQEELQAAEKEVHTFSKDPISFFNMLGNQLFGEN